MRVVVASTGAFVATALYNGTFLRSAGTAPANTQVRYLVAESLTGGGTGTTMVLRDYIERVF